MNTDLMTLEEMERRAKTCANPPLNRDDRVVVKETWMATIEICKRLDLLRGNSRAAEIEAEEAADCQNSPGNKCSFEFNGLSEDPTCVWCGRT